MKSCFLLWHTHTRSEDEDQILIGVYASSVDAKAAMQRIISQPGFKDHPEGFEIAEYIIGQDHWTEGFVTEEAKGSNE